MDNPTLQHHGIKGMKWGVRRFQNKNGGLTPIGRLRRKHHEKQVAKQRKENLEKARQARAAKKEHEENKQKVLRSGNATELLKYKGELTQREMDDAFRRIQWEQSMQSISAKETAVGKSKTEKMMDTLGNVTTNANTIIKAYNTAANIFNALNTNSMLPKISTNITEGNRKDYKAFKDQKKNDQNKSDQKKEQKKSNNKKQSTGNNSSNNQSSGPEVFSGTVEGEGTSRRQSSSGRQNRSRSNDDIIDADWSDVTVSNAESSRQTLIGQDYVTYLLEDNS